MQDIKAPLVSTKDNKATYQDEESGITVEYEAGNAALKETIILAGPTAPSAFTFEVRTDRELRAIESDAGGLELRNSEGEVVFAFAPPFMFDSAASPVYSDAVSLEVVEAEPRLLIRLTADAKWLGDPGRVWPVSIDPTLTQFFGLNTDIDSASPDSNFETNHTRRVGNPATSHELRTVWRLRNPALASFMILRQASLVLTRSPLDPGTATGSVTAHQITESWGPEDETTWNDRSVGVPWSTAGGTFASIPTASTTPGPIGSDSKWNITYLADLWSNDPDADLGVVLKSEGSGTYHFYSPAGTTHPSQWPRLVVDYESPTGLRDLWTYESQQLTENRSIHVNVASGNLVVREADLEITGTGLDATVERFYGSR